jgi:hypothetical protein
MSNVQTKWTPSERVADVALNRRIAMAKAYAPFGLFNKPPS